MTTASIYVLVEPGSGEIRYVGQTVRALNARLRSHLLYRGPGHRTAWIQSLGRRGLIPEIRLVQTVPTAERGSAERYWIAYFRGLGCDLTNGTEGGEGVLGFRHSEETRRFLSEQRKGIWGNRPGVVITPEARAKTSATLKANYGDHCSEGHPFDRVTRKGWRICSICDRRRQAAYRARRRG